MDPDRIDDLACRLEKAERSANYLRRLLVLGQSLTTEATKGEWARRVAREVLAVVRCGWAAYCVADREVDRIFLQRRRLEQPSVTIRPAGYLRRAAGDSWNQTLPARLDCERFGLPAELCWYLPVRVHDRVRGGLLLPSKCMHREPCTESSELLELLAHQVSLAAELAELHGDVVKAATFDRMTGVLNRESWIERAQARLEIARGHSENAAVVIFDLDHFKEVNDRLGHAAGDQFLIETASAARSVLRGEDLFGRFGGDEFVVWLENLSTVTLAAVIERLMVKVSTVASPYQKQLGDVDLTLGMSAGVAVTEGGGRSSIDAMLEAADVALYKAKASGRGTWRIVGPNGHARAS